MAFDDQGCNFDADGNMVNWWKPEDAEAFKNLTQGLVAQFDEVEVLPGLHANGQYTLGENIADQGGLRVAMTAFKDSQLKKGVDINSEAAKIDGFTPSQVFYMNFANLWKTEHTSGGDSFAHYWRRAFSRRESRERFAPQYRAVLRGIRNN